MSRRKRNNYFSNIHRKKKHSIVVLSILDVIEGKAKKDTKAQRSKDKDSEELVPPVIIGSTMIIPRVTGSTPIASATTSTSTVANVASTGASKPAAAAFFGLC